MPAGQSGASAIHPDSLWNATPAGTACPTLSADLDVDVAVVGGGIAGLTTALLLKRGGRTVALIEAMRIGEQVTGKSNAKVTLLHRLIYADLLERIGREGTEQYLRANQAAMQLIAGLVKTLEIDCGYEERPAYTFTARSESLKAIEAEVKALKSLGLKPAFLDEIPLPGPCAGAVRLDGQAQFDPVAYQRALARAFVEEGGILHEGTRVRSIEHGEPCLLTADKGTVRANDVVVATNLPIVPQGDFDHKTGPRAHLSVAGEIDPASAPEGMFLCMDAPTHSVRSARLGGKTHLVVVGESFAPGHLPDTEALYGELEAFVRKRFGPKAIQHRWMNMDYDSVDRLPYIGRAEKDCGHLWVATGFSSWGITLGTAAGIALAGSLTGEAADWAAPFEATREPGKAENDGHPPMRKEEAPKPRGSEWDELKPGEGAMFEERNDGAPIAGYRDEDGKLHLMSGKCTHVGCPLAWNPAEETWDCHCHGSLFRATGEVVHGPATEPLPPYEPERG